MYSVPEFPLHIDAQANELIQLNKNKPWVFFPSALQKENVQKVNVQKQQFANDYHTCLNMSWDDFPPQNCSEKEMVTLPLKIYKRVHSNYFILDSNVLFTADALAQMLTINLILSLYKSVDKFKLNI